MLINEHLAAKVERLLAENERLLAENKRLRAENAELRALTSEVELGGVSLYRLVGQSRGERMNVAELLTEFNRLRAHIEEMQPALGKQRDQNESLVHELAKLKAVLTWFEERERALNTNDFTEFRIWEREHPKPGAT